MNNEVYIDVEALRNYLIDYFGTAMFNGNPVAMFELEKVKNASGYEIVSIAQKNNINLNKYIVSDTKKNRR